MHSFVHRVAVVAILWHAWNQHVPSSCAQVNGKGGHVSGSMAKRTTTDGFSVPVTARAALLRYDLRILSTQLPSNFLSSQYDILSQNTRQLDLHRTLVPFIYLRINLLISKPEKSPYDDDITKLHMMDMYRGCGEHLVSPKDHHSSHSALMPFHENASSIIYHWTPCKPNQLQNFALLWLNGYSNTSKHQFYC